MPDTRIWPYIVIPMAFVTLFVTSTALLWMAWEPLAVIPFAVYTWLFVWYNTKKCVCGHRFGRHNSQVGWCGPCQRAWRDNPSIPSIAPTGQRVGWFCTRPRETT